MVLLCRSCDIKGDETNLGEMPNEICKSKCLKDKDCIGIDIIEEFPTGACYLNYGFKNAKFNAWKKESCDKD